MDWSYLLLQFILCYISTICFGILLNIPKQAYNIAGIIGGGTWVVYWILYYRQGIGLAFCNLIAAILISILSQLAAHHKRIPMIVFNVPALVSFVPGGQAYKMVRNFAIGNYHLVTVYFYQVVVIVGAITLGFGIGELLDRMRKYLWQYLMKKSRWNH